MSVAPCPPSSPAFVPGVVTFIPADFKVAFPEFATIADAVLTGNFDFATLQLNNTCRSQVCDAPTREKLLNLLVAHITTLRNGANGDGPSGLVGRINRAQEGSVSVGTDMGVMVYGQAYYAQTQWGAMYWQATSIYRRFRYVPAPITCADVQVSPGFYPPGGGGCGC